MTTYSYVSENGRVYKYTTYYNWRSLCHKEDVMDGWNMLEEVGGFGWSMCRQCGKPSSFYKEWPHV